MELLRGAVRGVKEAQVEAFAPPLKVHLRKPPVHKPPHQYGNVQVLLKGLMPTRAAPWRRGRLLPCKLKCRALRAKLLLKSQLPRATPLPPQLDAFKSVGALGVASRARSTKLHVPFDVCKPMKARVREA